MRCLLGLAFGFLLVGCPRVKESDTDTGPVEIIDNDGDGFSADADCDDSNAAIYPGADELCDGVDNNCDDVIDEATATDATTWYEDSDSDGYGDDGETTTACEAETGWVADNTDCNDDDATINPGQNEICYDGVVDEDCDNHVDCDDPDCASFEGCDPDLEAPTWPTDTELLASDITETSVTLSWDAASDNIMVTSYFVFQDGTEIMELGGSMTSVTVTGLTSATEYYFYVEAGDLAGNITFDGPLVDVTTASESAPSMNGTLSISYDFDESKTVCNEDCYASSDGDCDDGGPDSDYDVCDFGSDCTDCGTRSAWLDRLTVCSEECEWSGDDVCDDGGEGSTTSVCDWGSDCLDCGERVTDWFTYEDCSTTINLTPSATAAVEGCDDCDYTWSVEFEELTSTCDPVWYSDSSGEEIDLGLVLTSETLWLNHGEGDGWVEYGSGGDSVITGSIADTTFTGTGVFTNSTTRWELEECIQTSTETFILTW